MMLPNPKAYSTDYQEQCFQDLVDKTINFFETKGLKQIKKDDQSMVWYDDFLTFAKMADSGEYVFFSVDLSRCQYECVKKIDTSGVRQAYVVEYVLHDYPVTEADIISRGKHAWNSSLNTINIV